MTFAELRDKLLENRCRPSVVARILKMNPDGTEPGSVIRGWHRRVSWWMLDQIGPKTFIEAHGREVYRKVHPRHWRLTGRRKAMDRTYFLDHMWSLP